MNRSPRLVLKADAGRNLADFGNHLKGPVREVAVQIELAEPEAAGDVVGGLLAGVQMIGQLGG